MRSRRSLCLLAALALAASGASARAQAPQAFDEFREQASVDALRAQLDPTINARVAQIWWQLARYSGRMFPVVPAQQYNIGQALPNGVVLLDLSTAGNDHPEVTAFFLGHEWAHQVLGHPRLTIEQQGEVVAAYGPTAAEDAADRWAARFVRVMGYDTAPIYEYLCSLPGGDAGDAHSSGPARARNAAAVIGDRDGDPCDAAPVTVDVRFAMWSLYEGSPASFDIAIDGQDQTGSMNNLGDADGRFFDATGLALGRHTVALTNIFSYDRYGHVVAGPYWCNRVIYVTRSTQRMAISIRLDASGIACQIAEAG